MRQVKKAVPRWRLIVLLATASTLLTLVGATDGLLAAVPIACWAIIACVAVRLPAPRLLDLFIVAGCISLWASPVMSFGLNLRPAQIVLVPYAVRRFALRGLNWKTRFVPYGVAGAAMIGAVVGSTLLHAGLGTLTAASPEAALGHAVLMGLNVLTLLATADLAAEDDEFARAGKVFVTTVVVLNLWTLAIYTGRALDIEFFRRLTYTELNPTLGGVYVETIRMAIGPLIGMFTAAALLFMLVAMAQRAWRRWPVSIILQAAILTAALVVGADRAPFLGFACGLIVLAFGVVRARRRRLLFRTFGLGVTGLSLIWLLVFAGPEQVRTSLSTVLGRTQLLLASDQYSQGTLGDRTVMWSFLWRDALRSPIIGYGQDSADRFYSNQLGYVDVASVRQGVHSLFFDLLHSSGALGLVPWMLMEAWVIVALVRARAKLNPLGAWTLLGVHACLLVGALTNLTYWTPMYWVVMGWTVAAAERTNSAHRLRHTN